MSIEMKFKSQCKFCGENGLAWKTVDQGNGIPKWVLFANSDSPHKCHYTKESKSATDINNEKIKKQEKHNPCIEQAVFIEGIGKTKTTKTKAVNKVKLAKVKLAHATSMYQPVWATTKGSTYIVVALFKGINMAARIKMYTGFYEVSVRIEGSALSDMKNKDNLSKFNIPTDGDYGSVHFKCDNRIECNAIIFAYMGMIGLPCFSHVPDLNKFIK